MSKPTEGQMEQLYTLGYLDEDGEVTTDEMAMYIIGELIKDKIKARKKASSKDE